MEKKRDAFMEIFKRLRREKDEIETERQEIARSYLTPLSSTPFSVKRKLSHIRKRKAKKRRIMQNGKRKKVKSAKSTSVKEHSLLKDALGDLEKELRSLRAARRQLEGEMEKLTGELGFTQNKEIALRNKISELMKNETKLEEKRSLLKDRFNEVLKRIEKVRTIETQLKEM